LEICSYRRTSYLPLRQGMRPVNTAQLLPNKELARWCYLFVDLFIDVY
jgi:hypothetical protein